MSKTLKEMSLEELDVRGAELRNDLCELSDGERSAENGERISALLREAEIHDKVHTLARIQAMREADKRAVEDAKNSIGPRGATGQHGLTVVRDFGGRLAGNEAFKEWLEGGMRNSDGSVNLNINLDGFIHAGTRDIDEWGSGGPPNAATGAINTLLPVGQPIAPIPRQARLAMRDLIPSQPTTLSQVPYVRELTPTANELAASAVAEGGTKPDASLNFDGESSPITVIAVSVSPSKQLWADAPLVVAYINMRLPYLTRFKEDAEIIAGSGTWPDVRGIKNTTGVQTRGAVNSDSAQTIGMAIADVENVDGTATGVVLNPTDAWSMFTKRAAGGSGTFDAGVPFSIESAAALTVWGLPTVRSRAYASGTSLVGDFAHGAMILDREGVNVQIFPQHSDYAVKNKILVLCEERLGLAVFRPDYFVTATMSAS